MRKSTMPGLQNTLAPHPAKLEEKKNDVVLDKKSVPWWWMKNDKGKSSVSVTFATVSFFITTLVYLAAAFEKLGPITFRTFDVGACMAYFLPSLSLYFGRRLTDAKYPSSETKSTQD